MMEAAPGAALEVVEADLLLHLLVVALECQGRAAWAGGSERHGARQAGAHGSMTDDAQASLALPLVVVHVDLEPRTAELFGGDGVALAWIESGGAVELDQATARHGEPAQAGALKDEVLGHPIAAGRHTLEGAWTTCTM
jgi:hypothetical protein